MEAFSRSVVLVILLVFLTQIEGQNTTIDCNGQRTVCVGPFYFECVDTGNGVMASGGEPKICPDGTVCSTTGPESCVPFSNVQASEPIADTTVISTVDASTEPNTIQTNEQAPASGAVEQTPVAQALENAAQNVAQVEEVVPAGTTLPEAVPQAAALDIPVEPSPALSALEVVASVPEVLEITPEIQAPVDSATVQEVAIDSTPQAPVSKTSQIDAVVSSPVVAESPVDIIESVPVAAASDVPVSDVALDSVPQSSVAATSQIDAAVSSPVVAAPPLDLPESVPAAPVPEVLVTVPEVSAQEVPTPVEAEAPANLVESVPATQVSEALVFTPEEPAQEIATGSEVIASEVGAESAPQAPVFDASQIDAPVSFPEVPELPVDIAEPVPVVPASEVLGAQEVAQTDAGVSSPVVIESPDNLVEPVPATPVPEASVVFPEGPVQEIATGSEVPIPEVVVDSLPQAPTSEVSQIDAAVSSPVVEELPADIVEPVPAAPASEIVIAVPEVLAQEVAQADAVVSSPVVAESPANLVESIPATSVSEASVLIPEGPAQEIATVSEVPASEVAIDFVPQAPVSDISQIDTVVSSPVVQELLPDIAEPVPEAPVSEVLVTVPEVSAQEVAQTDAAVSSPVLIESPDNLVESVPATPVSEASVLILEGPAQEIATGSEVPVSEVVVDSIPQAPVSDVSQIDAAVSSPVVAEFPIDIVEPVPAAPASEIVIAVPEVLAQEVAQADAGISSPVVVESTNLVEAVPVTAASQDLSSLPESPVQEVAAASELPLSEVALDTPPQVPVDEASQTDAVISPPVVVESTADTVESAPTAPVSGDLVIVPEVAAQEVVDPISEVSASEFPVDPIYQDLIPQAVPTDAGVPIPVIAESPADIVDSVPVAPVSEALITIPKDPAQAVGTGSEVPASEVVVYTVPQTPVVVESQSDTGLSPIVAESPAVLVEYDPAAPVPDVVAAVPEVSGQEVVQTDAGVSPSAVEELPANVAESIPATPVSEAVVIIPEVPVQEVNTVSEVSASQAATDTVPQAAIAEGSQTPSVLAESPTGAAESGPATSASDSVNVHDLPAQEGTASSISGQEIVQIIPAESAQEAVSVPEVPVIETSSAGLVPEVVTDAPVSGKIEETPVSTSAAVTSEVTNPTLEVSTEPDATTGPVDIIADNAPVISVVGAGEGDLPAEVGAVSSVTNPVPTAVEGEIAVDGSTSGIVFGPEESIVVADVISSPGASEISNINTVVGEVAAYPSAPIAPDAGTVEVVSQTTGAIIESETPIISELPAVAAETPINPSIPGAVDIASIVQVPVPDLSEPDVIGASSAPINAETIISENIVEPTVGSVVGAGDEQSTGVSKTLIDPTSGTVLSEGSISEATDITTGEVPAVVPEPSAIVDGTHGAIDTSTVLVPSVSAAEPEVGPVSGTESVGTTAAGSSSTSEISGADGSLNNVEVSANGAAGAGSIPTVAIESPSSGPSASEVSIGSSADSGLSDSSISSGTNELPQVPSIAITDPPSSTGAGDIAPEATEITSAGGALDTSTVLVPAITVQSADVETVSDTNTVGVAISDGSSTIGISGIDSSTTSSSTTATGGVDGASSSGSDVSMGSPSDASISDGSTSSGTSVVSQAPSIAVTGGAPEATEITSAGGAIDTSTVLVPAITVQSADVETVSDTNTVGVASSDGSSTIGASGIDSSSTSSSATGTGGVDGIYTSGSEVSIGLPSDTGVSDTLATSGSSVGSEAPSIAATGSAPETTEITTVGGAIDTTAVLVPAITVQGTDVETVSDTNTVGVAATDGSSTIGTSVIDSSSTSSSASATGGVDSASPSGSSTIDAAGAGSAASSSGAVGTGASGLGGDDATSAISGIGVSSTSSSATVIGGVDGASPSGSASTDVLSQTGSSGDSSSGAVIVGASGSGIAVATSQSSISSSTNGISGSDGLGVGVESTVGIIEGTESTSSVAVIGDGRNVELSDSTVSDTRPTGNGVGDVSSSSGISSTGDSLSSGIGGVEVPSPSGISGTDAVSSSGLEGAHSPVDSISVGSVSGDGVSITSATGAEAQSGISGSQGAPAISDSGISSSRGSGLESGILSVLIPNGSVKGPDTTESIEKGSKSTSTESLGGLIKTIDITNAANENETPLPGDQVTIHTSDVAVELQPDVPSSPEASAENNSKEDVSKENGASKEKSAKKEDSNEEDDHSEEEKDSEEEEEDIEIGRKFVKTREQIRKSLRRLSKKLGITHEEKFKCLEEGYFADPNSCTKYHICSRKNGEGSKFKDAQLECPSYQLYDMKLNKCGNYRVATCADQQFFALVLNPKNLSH